MKASSKNSDIIRMQSVNTKFQKNNTDYVQKFDQFHNLTVLKYQIPTL